MANSACDLDLNRRRKALNLSLLDLWDATGINSVRLIKIDGGIIKGTKSERLKLDKAMAKKRRKIEDALKGKDNEQ